MARDRIKVTLCRELRYVENYVMERITLWRELHYVELHPAKRVFSDKDACLVGYSGIYYK